MQITEATLQTDRQKKQTNTWKMQDAEMVSLVAQNGEKHTKITDMFRKLLPAELSSLTSEDMASVTESAATSRVFLIPHAAFATTWLPPVTSGAPAPQAAADGWNACIMLLPIVASWSFCCWRHLLTAGRTAAELCDPMRGLNWGDLAFCQHHIFTCHYSNNSHHHHYRHHTGV